MRAGLMCLWCCLLPVLATAQSPSPSIPKYDAAVTLGWAGAEYKIPSYDTWRGTLLLGARGGLYWTEHLKTEVQAAWMESRDAEVFENIEHNGGSTYALFDFRARDVRVGVMQVYQFGHNQWVHPYVGAGVDFIARTTTRDRAEQQRTIYLPNQNQNQNVPITISALSERKTETLVQPTVKTGLKMYVNERVFFDTEFKLGLARDVEHVTWNIGVGFDF